MTNRRNFIKTVFCGTIAALGFNFTERSSFKLICQHDGEPNWGYSDKDGYYVGYKIRGSGESEWHDILEYDGKTKTATLDSELRALVKNQDGTFSWTSPCDDTRFHLISPDGGYVIPYRGSLLGLVSRQIN